MPPTYIPKMFNLEINDLRIIRQVAEQRGLGDKAASAVLRSIIRQWAQQNLAYHTSENSEFNMHQVRQSPGAS